jgi:hypothetical protein
MVTLQYILWTVLKLALFSAVVVYAGAVLVSYSHEGSGYSFRFNRRRPAWTAEHVLVWFGVKLVGGMVRVGRPALNMLSEASAEVGEWVIARSPKVRDAISPTQEK